MSISSISNVNVNVNNLGVKINMGVLTGIGKRTIPNASSVRTLLNVADRVLNPIAFGQVEVNLTIKKKATTLLKKLNQKLDIFFQQSITQLAKPRIDPVGIIKGWDDKEKEFERKHKLFMDIKKAAIKTGDLREYSSKLRDHSFSMEALAHHLFTWLEADRSDYRPQIRFIRDEVSLLRTRFAKNFNRISKIVAEYNKIKNIEDPKLGKLKTQFNETITEIRDASMDEEFARGLVEIFNYLAMTVENDSNWDCPFSVNVLRKLITIPNIDLSLLEQATLALSMEMEPDYLVYRMVMERFKPFIELLKQRIDELKSTDSKKAEYAAAWIKVMRFEDTVEDFINSQESIQDYFELS